MKLVLFGAGASVDAGLGASPPLTSSLFSALKIFAPHSWWGTLTKEEQQLFKPDFEKGMEELLGAQLNMKRGDVFELKFPLSSRKQLLCDLQWDLAEFFFCFVLKHDNLYEELLTRTQHVGGTVEYSTLNYDTLLIQAVNRINTRNPDAQYSVSFPHGCTAFFCEAYLNSDGHVTVPKGHAVEFNPTSYGFMQSNGPVRLIRGLREFRELRQKGSVFPPVICHIDPTKYVTAGANFIVEQQKKLEWQIRKAEQIVIIGMNLNENDHHIWEPLRSAKGDILYISGSSGASKFQGWRNKHCRRNDQALPCYWNEGKNQVYEFLSV